MYWIQFLLNSVGVIIIFFLVAEKRKLKLFTMDYLFLFVKVTIAVCLIKINL